MDSTELRFRAQQTARSDATTMNSLTSPQRNRLSQNYQQQQQQQQQQQPAQDPRTNLSRRFTTDSARVPTLSSNIGGPRGPDEYQSLHTLQLIEKKRLEFERIKEKKRQFDAELHKHEQETSRLFEAELQKHSMELSQMVEEHARVAGHQSEPTTPPEYHATTTGFPTALSRPNANRYSLSSLQSPTGMFGRAGRSGSILASPQSGVPMSRFAFDDQLPPWSQQASRRNSDEDEKEEAVRQDPTSHRATNAVNRYSMPVTKSRTAFYDIDNLDQANTTGFLFRDDESAPEGKLYTKTTTEDSYSTLIRQSNMSFNSITTQAFNEAAFSPRRGQTHNISPNRFAAPAQSGGSIPCSRSNMSQTTSNCETMSPPSSSVDTLSPQKLLTSGSQSTVGSETAPMGTRPASYRNSADLNTLDLQKYGDVLSDATTPTSNGNSNVLTTPPKLVPSSFSTGDVPNLKQASAPGVGVGVTPNHAAQQHLHNHNASMGRFPAGAAPRHNRDMSTDARGHNAAAFQVLGSVLQGDSNAFIPGQAPMQTSAFGSAPQAPAANGMVNNPQGVSPFGNVFNNGGYTPNGSAYSPGVYSNAQHGYNHAVNGAYPGNGGPYSSNGYSGNVGPAVVGPAGFITPSSTLNGNGTGTPGSLLQSMNGLALTTSNGSFSNNGYSPANGYASSDYGNYPGMYTPTQPRDSQTRVMQNRRQQDNEAMNKFANQPLSVFRGQIYSMCKDQHGCRYVQKQLENRDPQNVHLVWLEVCDHVVELMTDPFGNYLCQRLFEYCDDSDRTRLVENASRDMVNIATNQHGTRALQRMIENLSNPQQAQMVIGALTGNVVDLIEDLNGNHVIQKCLNKLDAHDAQFIFDAVSAECVRVGTHRHGCCVIQRCIDHAQGEHKQRLVAAITEHAYEMVKDAYGNYVIQYIIDLNDPVFTNCMVSQFLDELVPLSCLKFSSNVVEKCLRCASDNFKDMIVDRLMASGMLEELVRNQFGNYVVQTAIEHATSHQKARLVDAVRPMLPAIKTTAFGRKIQHKIATYDSTRASLSGPRLAANQRTPADATMGQLSLRPAAGRGSFGYRNGNHGSNASNVNGGSYGSQGANPTISAHSIPGAFMSSTEIVSSESQRDMQNQSVNGIVAAPQVVSQVASLQAATPQRAQPKQNFMSPQRTQQSKEHSTPQRNQKFTPERPQLNQKFTPGRPQAQDFVYLQQVEAQEAAAAEAAQQNQQPGFQQPQDYASPQGPQSHYAQPQQIPNRFGAFASASRNGSPGVTGAPGIGAPFNGAAGNGAPGYAAPTQGAPGHGAPAQGAPGNGTPARRTPPRGSAQGTPVHGMSSNGQILPALPQNGDGAFF